MKQINYTGTSKLISRIVALLNGKAPLPVDENEDVTWGTSGQVLTTDGSGATAWADGSSIGQTYTAGDGIDITSNVISSAYFCVDSDGYLCQIYDDGT